MWIQLSIIHSMAMAINVCTQFRSYLNLYGKEWALSEGFTAELCRIASMWSFSSHFMCISKIRCLILVFLLQTTVARTGSKTCCGCNLPVAALQLRESLVNACLHVTVSKVVTPALVSRMPRNSVTIAAQLTHTTIKIINQNPMVKFKLLCAAFFPQKWLLEFSAGLSPNGQGWEDAHSSTKREFFERLCVRTSSSLRDCTHLCFIPLRRLCTFLLPFTFVLATPLYCVVSANAKEKLRMHSVLPKEVLVLCYPLQMCGNVHRVVFWFLLIVSSCLALFPFFACIPGRLCRNTQAKSSTSQHPYCGAISRS